MSKQSITTSKIILDPQDRFCEIMVGLIITLAFTCSLSVTNASRNDVRLMLIGALGCNLAWGIIDGFLYLMGCIGEKGRYFKTLQAVRSTTDPEEAQQIIISTLPPIAASILKPEELKILYSRLQKLPEPAKHARLDKMDLIGALTVVLIVFFSTFPMTVPFIVTQNIKLALRISNFIAVITLFVIGYSYGREVGRSPLWFGLTMIIFGGALVAVAIALGG